MKLKPVEIILKILLFSVGLAGCIMIFMKLEVPTAMAPICTILLVISSMSEFMKTRKLKKLIGPLIIIYFLVGMPNIGRITNNTIVQHGYVVLGFIVTIIFVYTELIISNKEKDLSHK